MIRNVSIDATAAPSICTLSNNNHNNSENLKLKMNTKKKKKRSPVFPQRLYEMLEDADQEGYSHLISWSPDGMSFKISYDAKNNSSNKSFVEVLKRRFNQTHFKSFLRQLQLYGFERQFKGARKGECKHPLFQRNHKELLFGKSIEEYQDATTHNTILANRICTNQQHHHYHHHQQQLELVSSTQEVDTTSIPPPPPLHRHVTTDEPTITTSCTSTSKCKYRSTSTIPTTLTNLVLPDDNDDDDNADNQDNINQDDYDDDDDATKSNDSDNNSLGSSKVFNRTFVGTDADTVPISRKSKVLLMCPLIWNDTCDDYEYDGDCDDNVDMRDENMISVDDHNNYNIPQRIGSSIYRI